MDEKRQKLIFLVDDDAKLRKLLVNFEGAWFVLREFSDGSNGNGCH